jgi:ABC-type branched-subunit amino acid transport system substrate-binding protein
VEAFRKANPEQDQVYNYNAAGYDAMMFFANALAKAPDGSREGVLKGMQAVAAEGGFDGAAGPIKFVEPDNRDVTVPGVVVEWRDGKENLISQGDPAKEVQP